MAHAGDGEREAARRAHAHAVDCEWAEWEKRRRKTRQASLQTIVLWVAYLLACMTHAHTRTHAPTCAYTTVQTRPRSHEAEKYLRLLYVCAGISCAWLYAYMLCVWHMCIHEHMPKRVHTSPCKHVHAVMKHKNILYFCMCMHEFPAHGCTRASCVCKCMREMIWIQTSGITNILKNLFTCVMILHLYTQCSNTHLSCIHTHKTGLFAVRPLWSAQSFAIRS